MVENNKPIKTYKVGVLSLSMWENESKENDGGKLKSFTFQRSYKDLNEKWQHTQLLRLSDLPKLRILIEEAYKDVAFSERD